MLTKKLRIMTLCLIAVMTVAGVAVAAPMTTNIDTMPGSFTTGAYEKAEVIDGKSPLTGLDWSGDYRPILVQISNAKEARPQANLSEADIVYEMIYWGPAHTRYMAVYNDNHPDYVGYIRSARMGYVELREEWDAPYVFYGGQDIKGSSVYDFMKQQEVPADFKIDGTRNGKGLYRTQTKVNPHNAYANLQEIVSQYWPKGEDGNPYEPKMHAFAFTDMPLANGDSATEVYIPYDEKEYYPSYKYNSSSRVYERYYNGEPQMDEQSGKQIVASNVIVQFADLQFVNGNKSRPLVATTGSGIMDAFIDGRHVRGTWERKNLTDPTVFKDASGTPIAFYPGKTFIQIIPNSNEYRYVRSDGTEVKLDVGMEVEEAYFDPSEGDGDIDKMEDATK